MWDSSVRLIYTMWGSSVRLIYTIWGSSVRLTSILINFFVRWVCKTRILKLILQLKMSEVKLIWQMALTFCQTGFISERLTSLHWRRSAVRWTSSLSRLPICYDFSIDIPVKKSMHTQYHHHCHHSFYHDWLTIIGTKYDEYVNTKAAYYYWV